MKKVVKKTPAKKIKTPAEHHPHFEAIEYLVKQGLISKEHYENIILKIHKTCDQCFDILKSKNIIPEKYTSYILSQSEKTDLLKLIKKQTDPEVIQCIQMILKENKCQENIDYYSFNRLPDNVLINIISMIANDKQVDENVMIRKLFDLSETSKRMMLLVRRWMLENIGYPVLPSDETGRLLLSPKGDKILLNNKVLELDEKWEEKTELKFLTLFYDYYVFIDWVDNNNLLINDFNKVVKVNISSKEEKIFITNISPSMKIPLYNKHDAIVYRKDLDLYIAGNYQNVTVCKCREVRHLYTTSGIIPEYYMSWRDKDFLTIVDNNKLIHFNRNGDHEIILNDLNIHFISWSPDGEILAVITNKKLYMFYNNMTEYIYININCGYVYWDSDGLLLCALSDHITFLNRNGAIIDVLNIDIFDTRITTSRKLMIGIVNETIRIFDISKIYNKLQTMDTQVPEIFKVENKTVRIFERESESEESESESEE